MDSQEDLDKFAAAVAQATEARDLRERIIEEVLRKRKKAGDIYCTSMDSQEDVDRCGAATSRLEEALGLQQRIIEEILRKRAESGDTNRFGPWSSPSPIIRF
jgi:uncharacterized membrane protein YccC